MFSYNPDLPAGRVHSRGHAARTTARLDHGAGRDTPAVLRTEQGWVVAYPQRHERGPAVDSRRAARRACATRCSPEEGPPQVTHQQHGVDRASWSGGAAPAASCSGVGPVGARAAGADALAEAQRRELGRRRSACWRAGDATPPAPRRVELQLGTALPATAWASRHACRGDARARRAGRLSRVAQLPAEGRATGPPSRRATRCGARATAKLFSRGERKLEIGAAGRRTGGGRAATATPAFLCPTPLGVSVIDVACGLRGDAHREDGTELAKQQVKTQLSARPTGRPSSARDICKG